MDSNNNSITTHDPIAVCGYKISGKGVSLSIFILQQRLLVIGEQRCSPAGRDNRTSCLVQFKPGIDLGSILCQGIKREEEQRLGRSLHVQTEPSRIRHPHAARFASIPARTAYGNIRQIKSMRSC